MKTFLYLLLVKTNGVAFLEHFSRARDCSLPSAPESPPLPVKGQEPLTLDPLPPILRDKTLFISSQCFRSARLARCSQFLSKARSWKSEREHKEKERS